MHTNVFFKYITLNPWYESTNTNTTPNLTAVHYVGTSSAQSNEYIDFTDLTPIFNFYCLDNPSKMLFSGIYWASWGYCRNGNHEF